MSISPAPDLKRVVSGGSVDKTPTTFTIPDPHSVEQHGRSFHGYREGKYQFPNDGEEQDRLDIQHECWLRMLNGVLYWAPIGRPKNVLDIGTGTGIWAIQFAKQHPQARITGTDLSLIQPVSEKTPTNCDFVRDDVEEKWIFPDPFDFIHLRTMVTCFDDPKKVMQTAYDRLVPGGWIEYQDFAFEIVAADESSEEFVRNSAFVRWYDLVRRGLWNATGRDMSVPQKYKEWMEEMGFANVVEKRVLSPVNGWPLDPEDKRLGQFWHSDIEKVLEGAIKMLLAAGLTEEEIPEFVKDVRLSISDRKLRAYYIHYVVYGQKPDWPSKGAVAPVS